MGSLRNLVHNPLKRISKKKLRWSRDLAQYIKAELKERLPDIRFKVLIQRTKEQGIFIYWGFVSCIVGPKEIIITVEDICKQFQKIQIDYPTLADLRVYHQAFDRTYEKYGYWGSVSIEGTEWDP